MLEKPQIKIPEKPQSEREQLERQDRREFLKKLGIAFTVFGLGGVEAVLSTGCALLRKGLSSEEVEKGLERFQGKIEDPNNYLRYLDEREFVIKNEIFDSYARTVDKRPEWLGVPEGGFLSENYLDTKKERQEFRERLRERGLSDDEIRFYESLFSSTDIIIFRESILRSEYFLKALPHERFHRAIKRLTDEEYKTMKQAAREITSRKEEGAIFVREKLYADKKFYGGHVAAANMNWEEFYTYLAQGEFTDRTEEALKAYPEAYSLFLKIKKSCELKK